MCTREGKNLPRTATNGFEALAATRVKRSVIFRGEDCLSRFVISRSSVRFPASFRTNHLQAKFDRASQRKTRFVHGFVHGLQAIPFSATRRTITSRLSLNAFQ